MKTLDDVLQRLAQIIASAKNDGSPLGYFAALYHAMTAAVQRDMAAGAFDDAARMERLDVVFAQRYFTAFEAWQAGGGAPVPQSWTVAFEASKNEQVIVLQHLVLGVHAHINFDLGVAAAEIAPGEQIFQLENDFRRINAIIAQLTDRVQQGLTEIWRPMAIFDSLLRTRDEGFLNFSTQAARESAWQAARALAFLDGAARQQFVTGLDGSVAFFARKILKPGFFIESALPLIRRTESGSVAEKIGWLENMGG